jgi:dihydroneopterin aldolase
MAPITVLKIGGSLLESDEAAHLMRAVAASSPQRLVIVPGGGQFADEVRAAQKRYGLSEPTAHHMALLAMEMVGAVLVDFAPGFALAETVEEFAAAWQRNQTPIWAPARMVLASPEIPASWDVTSDSLAAWLAGHISATRLVLVKSCEVPAAIACDPSALATEGIVDRGFSALVAGQAFAWAVVSGAEGALSGPAGLAGGSAARMAG